MGNLAYKVEQLEEHYTQHDMIDVKVNEKVIRGIHLEERNNKLKTKKTYSRVFIYGIIFIMHAILCINLKVEETKSRIRIEQMKVEKKELIRKTNLLKSNFDKSINLNKIEEQAKQNLNMSYIDKVNYITIKGN